MKFKVTFKSPDAISVALNEAANYESSKLEDDETRDQAKEDIKNELYDFTSTWVDFGEYITIEFDTEKNTATVLTK